MGRSRVLVSPVACMGTSEEWERMKLMTAAPEWGQVAHHSAGSGADVATLNTAGSSLFCRLPLSGASKMMTGGPRHRLVWFTMR